MFNHADLADIIRIQDEFCRSLAAAKTVADKRMALIDAWRESGYSWSEVERMLAAFDG